MNEDSGVRMVNVSQAIDNQYQTTNIALSQCAAKYACAIANPWSPSAMSSCVPWGDSRDTQKTTSFVRFDATVGTAGVGFVLISPTVANDANYAWYSGSTYGGVSANFVVTGTDVTTTVGVSGIPMLNLPYTRTNLSPNVGANSNSGTLAVKGRIVSVGVSASYTGTELNMGGLMYCFTDPTHANMFLANTGFIGNRGEADVSNVSRDKCWLMASAIDTDEMEFPVSSTPSEAINVLYPFSRSSFISDAAATGSFYNGAAPMVIVFTGTPGNTVHIEMIQHTEYVGTGTEGRTTPNILDTVGAAKVLSAANRVPQLKQSKPGRKYGDLFFEALKYTGKELLPVAVGALKAMLV